jgi:hypothetical protein
MQRWISFVILLALCLMGLIKLIIHRLDQGKVKEFSIEFLNKYREFCNGLGNNNFNSDCYQWLKLNSAKMQSQMGAFGVAHAYKPAFANYMYNNYEMIINGISHIRDLYNETNDWGLGRKIIYDEVSSIDDAILTYIGYLDNKISETISEVKNPMIWLREGIREVVTLPISLMYWGGLIRSSTYSNLSNNFFFKFVSFLISVVGLLSSIITIVTGYDPFIDIINKFYFLKQ